MQIDRWHLELDGLQKVAASRILQSFYVSDFTTLGKITMKSWPNLPNFYSMHLKYSKCSLSNLQKCSLSGLYPDKSNLDYIFAKLCGKNRKYFLG